MMEVLKNMWANFEMNHPKASKWVREGGLFFIFSNLVTIIQYIIYAFLPNLLGLELAGTDWSWPAIPVSLFGIDFTWNAIGYDVVYDAVGNVAIGGGLGYFIAMLVGSFLAQCINFPLQRNITFRSKGNPIYVTVNKALVKLEVNLVIIEASFICKSRNNLCIRVNANKKIYKSCNCRNCHFRVKALFITV